MRNLALLTMFCAGCFDYAGLSTQYGVDGAAAPADLGSDLSSDHDGSVVQPGVDLATAVDMLAPVDMTSVVGASCTADDGGTGVVSTTGSCLPSSCSDGVSMLGFSPPAGTTGSPLSGTGSVSNLFDGDICTGWNTGTTSASLTLMFPGPLTFSRVQVANGATPATNETYTFLGLVGGNWVQIGMHDYAAGAYGAQAPVSITPGTYDGLQISIAASPSAVLIFEVTLLP